MKNILHQIDGYINRFIPVSIRSFLLLCFLAATLIATFIPAKIKNIEVPISFDISFFDDPQYLVSMYDLNISNIQVEEDFSTIRPSSYFAIKKAPKKTTKPNSGSTVELLSSNNDKIQVTLNNVPQSLLNQANVVLPDKGYFTKHEWKTMDSEVRQKYIDAFIIKNWKAVHEEYTSTGVHPLIILVKGIDETNYGTSYLFYRSKNWGAIKYVESTRSLNTKLFRKNAYVFAQDDCGSSDCKFFKFNTVWEGRRAFSLFVKKSRYTKHLKIKNNISKNVPEDWCNALYQGGYSTSNNKGKFGRMSKEVLQRAKELGLPMYLKNYGV